MATKVKVAARLRPFITGEIPDDAVIVSPAEGTVSVSNPRPGANDRFKFSFASCYDQTATQEQIFKKDVKPLLDNVFNGLICTVFAYGVTSSGKTHTIQGTASEPGIIPRVVKALLETKHLISYGSASITLSYMEIYKDEAYDLLVARENASKLPIREDINGKIIVANLTEKPITSFQEFERIYNCACKSRSTGATNLNRASSRSHALLALTVTRLDPTAQKAYIGKINVVDLAGSENNKLTGNDSSRLAESAAINKSLTVLGQVVHALNTNASRIPYRDSKLTRILQDALGGSSIGLLICNLAPGMKFRQDSINSLNFASRTRQIENKPTVTEKESRSIKPFPGMLVPPSREGVRPPLAPRSIPAPSRISIGGGSLIPQLNSFGYHSGTIRHSIGGPEWIAEPNVKLPSAEQVGLDEKISRAVQQEVERRLAEREDKERERLQQLEQLERERLAERVRQEEEQQEAMMKKHEELNRLLQRTLRKAEKENQRITEDASPSKILSPKKAKKLAMAYVALGRDYLQAKDPDYNSALKLWLQAETYVPENKALKKRITELQVAIREGVPYRITKREKKKSIESPVSGSPSGSRDHKQSQKMRMKARVASAKERGEIVVAKTPSPRKRKSKRRDVFIDSDEEILEEQVVHLDA